MTFIQLEFLVFFALVFTSYWLLRDRRHQNLLLAVSSAVFYGWVHPWFLLLLYGSAVTDYLVGLAMERKPHQKGALLTLSMAINLGLLGTFKYFDFFVENLTTALGTLGISSGLEPLGLFFPVGISFYTFQTMSYTIDVYRGELKPRANFLDYVVFVSFFPQLVAGPVERASNLIPQFERERVFSWDACRTGMNLAMWGAFKKVVIADTIALYVNKVYLLKEPAGPLLWAAALGFAIQILTDFSGYTDIARGTARALGIELMQNFDHPYLAVNPSEFWKRWHISFSSWIRDYLYIPLGGSRGGQLGVLKSTFGAMTLSGLWHGASWNFVAWGVYHAALLTGYRYVTPRIPATLRKGVFGRASAVLIMFGFTVVGWMIFRETHTDRLIRAFTINPVQATPDEWLATVVLLGICLVCSLPLFVALAIETWVTPRMQNSPWNLTAQTTTWAVLTLVIFVFTRSTVNDFIYFQF